MLFIETSLVKSDFSQRVQFYVFPDLITWGRVNKSVHRRHGGSGPEAFEHTRCPRSGNITAVVNAITRAGVELGDNGSVVPKPKGKPR